MTSPGVDEEAEHQIRSGSGRHRGGRCKRRQRTKREVMSGVLRKPCQVLYQCEGAADGQRVNALRCYRLQNQ